MQARHRGLEAARAVAGRSTRKLGAQRESWALDEEASVAIPELDWRGRMKHW